MIHRRLHCVVTVLLLIVGFFYMWEQFHPVQILNNDEEESLAVYNYEHEHFVITIHPVVTDGQRKTTSSKFYSSAKTTNNTTIYQPIKAKKSKESIYTIQDNAKMRAKNRANAIVQDIADAKVQDDANTKANASAKAQENANVKGQHDAIAKAQENANSKGQDDATAKVQESANAKGHDDAIAKAQENANSKGQDAAVAKAWENAKAQAKDKLNVNQVQFPSVKDKKSKKKVEVNPVVLSLDKIVLVIAYMRTGSSLTGSIFRSYPKAFYLREPIGALVKTFKFSGTQDNITLQYSNGIYRTIKRRDKQKSVMDEIKNWLQCRVEKISMPSLNLVFNFSKDRYPSYCKYGLSKKCKKLVERLTTECKEASLKVLKFIRLRMLDVMELLPLFPNMQVIHLVRDPRGMFNSRINLKNYSVSEYKTMSVHGQCSTILNDLMVTKRILTRFPGRVKVVRYEDMAEGPNHTWKEISTFCGINFEREMQDYISTVTSANHDSCQLCVRRRSSATTANKWRKELSPGFGRYIYRACHKMNNILGYLPFKTNKDQYDMVRQSKYVSDIYSNLMNVK